MSPDVDVLIVGGGPAGATAARRLALGGARVQLLDRQVFPRNKPCGGGISLRVLRRFPYLVEALPRIPTRLSAKLYLVAPGGGATLIESHEPAALLVRRLDFDHLLLRLAQEAGAEVVEGADVARASLERDGVRLTARDGRVFQAPLVIAADGVNSVVARRIGLTRGWARSSVALDMMEETPNEQLRAVDPDALWVSYGHSSDDSPARGRAAEGYAYVFPKRDHVNVGVGYVLPYFRDAVRRPPYELQQTLVDVLTRQGILVGRSCRRHFTPFLIPVDGPLARTVHERVLLVGDAGGFVNGLTAEGIYYAMVSGDLAAHTILEARDDEPRSRWHRIDGLRRYEKAWKREIGPELRDSVLLRHFLFGDARRIDRVVCGARHDGPATQMLVRYAEGALSYRAVRRRLLLRWPLLGFRLAEAWARISSARR